MSIFKVKQWWSNDKEQSEELDKGVQNEACIKIDRFNSHSDSDCLIVAEGQLLKIYKPKRDENASHTLLEKDLNNAIIQVETGKFIAGSEDRQIFVLHSQSYAVYQLLKKEGHTDAGEQNILQPVIKHSFTRRAYSMTSGAFGSIKTRDFICIQALDGSLSFFDQETFLFMYASTDVIIPGPVCYIASSDSFVICKSTWILEIHSYQQLREFSDLNVRQNKKNVPQWVYNAGEEIMSVQVIQTSNNFSSILALGERHLCCFQDNGLMKYMIQFQFIPICFCAYLIGWYYEPTSRLLVMVASDDSKLYVYEGTTLLWSCDLLHPAISISRCFLKYLPGGLVTLSANGIVTVCYLGTEPDLNANTPSMVNDLIDPEEVQNELETVETALQKILEEKEDDNNRYLVTDKVLKIKADVGKPVQNLFQQFTEENDATLHLLMCPIVVMLTCAEPKLIQSVQITYDCTQPFTCSDPTVCMENIYGTEIIETQVFLSSENDISNARVKILFTIIDCDGKLIIMTREVLMPLSLYCIPAESKGEKELKFSIQTNHQCLNFTELLTDFTEEELQRHGNTGDMVAFSFRTTKNAVTIKAAEKEYSIEANDISDAAAILDHLTIKLSDHYTRMGVTDFWFHFRLNDLFKKQIILKFLKSIEGHAKERVRLKNLEDELSILQRQFTVIQKKLLMLYGSLPPGDCDPVEFLMRDTHIRIIQTVNEIIESRQLVSRAGSHLTAAGQTLVCILNTNTSDRLKIKLIKEMLALGSLYEDHQVWEEAVAQALLYILNVMLQRSDKDKEKLAPVTEQGILSHVNLKRFLKQIRMVLDKMFMNETHEDDKVENKTARIEEFVEVI